jgi:hypothetical protein
MPQGHHQPLGGRTMSATSSPATWRPIRSELRSAKERARTDAEPVRDLQERGERHVELASLDRAEVAAVEPDVRRERLLPITALSSGRPNRLAKRPSRRRFLRGHRSDDVAGHRDHPVRGGRREHEIAQPVQQSCADQRPHERFRVVGFQLAADVRQRPDRRLIGAGHQIDRLAVQNVELGLRDRVLVHGSYRSCVTAGGQFTLAPRPTCIEPPTLGFPDARIKGFRQSFRQALLELFELEQKKQLLLIGPSGTGKTYAAMALAQRVIRRHALALWAPVEHSQRQTHIEKLMDGHIRLLQLHATYSYEDFVGGPRLREGNIVFEDGYLLRLIDEINREQIPESGRQLPWVLILDELDRADVNRVFGEIFSILEDREQAVHLHRSAPHQPSRMITLPAELYVIGTLVAESVDQVDEALRRRFPLARFGFDRTRLLEVLQEQWQKTTTAAHYPWSRIHGEMELFGARAERLNEEIADSVPRGRNYEIGHAFFSRVVTLLANWDGLDRDAGADRLLWNHSGEALAPVHELWRMSLEPFVDWSLQVVDAGLRDAALLRFANVFLTGKT